MTSPENAAPAPSPEQLAKDQEKQFYFDRAKENRLKAGQGFVYYNDARQNNTPLLFRAYGGQELVGTILKDGGTTFTLRLAAGRKVVDKLTLQYACEAQHYESLRRAVTVDQSVRSLGLEPIVEVKERYRLPDDTLQTCRSKKHKLRLKLRGGEVVEGAIEWFGIYDIGIKVAGGILVVVFRHSVYRHQVVKGK